MKKSKAPTTVKAASPPIPSLPAKPVQPARFAEPVKRATPEGMAARLGMTLQMPYATATEEWTFDGRKDEEPDEALARMRTAPVYNAAQVIHAFNGTANDTLRGMVNELDRQAKAVNGGDLTQLEAMLAAQAHTLDAMFSRLAKRAHMNMAEHLGASETYFRLAFKAQSQCRATVESLGQLKNPSPVAFVKQANIAAGPQQINNGVAPSPELPRAGEIGIPPIKQLEAANGERMDTRQAGKAGKANQTVEAVGAVNRPTNGRRKGKGRQERR